MNLLWEYERVNASSKYKWCNFYGIFLPRLKRLESSCLHLSRRVADFLGINDDLLRVTIPPTRMPHAMVTVLRIVQVWVFNDTIIQFDPSIVKVSKSEDSLTLDLLKQSDRIDRAHLEQLLRTERHPFSLSGQSEVRQKGTFDYVVDEDRERQDICFHPGFEERLLSYATEKGFSLSVVGFADCVSVYCREILTKDPDFIETLPMLFQDNSRRSRLVAKYPSRKVRRGRAERPCGTWTINSGNGDASLGHETDVNWVKFIFKQSKTNKKDLRKLEDDLNCFNRKSSLESISCKFPWNSGHDTASKSLSFQVVVRGSKKGIAEIDLRDLLASSCVQSSAKESFDQQKLEFPYTANAPLNFNGQKTPADRETSSWTRPLVECIPEAARILSVLASGRRREHVVRLPSLEKTSDDKGDDIAFLDLHLESNQTKITYRWKRFNTSLAVFVEINSVPASAVPIRGSDIIYCSCANTLELRGGGIRAEGLTLLPPGKLFLLLCELTFGLTMQDDVDDESTIRKSILRVDPKCEGAEKKLLSERIERALRFNSSVVELGEKLECFPEKVNELIAVFDGVDGYESTAWSNLVNNPFIGANLQRCRRDYKLRRKAAQPSTRSLEDRHPGGQDSSVVEDSTDREGKFIPATSSQLDSNFEIHDRSGINLSDILVLATNQGAPTLPEVLSSDVDPTFRQVTFYSEDDLLASERLFATTLPLGQVLNESDLPSSNILSIVVQQFRTEIGGPNTSGFMTLDGPDWNVHAIALDGSTWYYATFSGGGVPYVRRTSRNHVAWLKHADFSKARPNSVNAISRCVPPGLIAVEQQAKLVASTADKGATLVFSSLELAVQIESAFWLERQFLSGKRHWYQNFDIAKMVARLKSEYQAEKKRNEKSNNTS